jgi:tetratricopeptide (TPR) repeat protein
MSASRIFPAARLNCRRRVGDLQSGRVLLVAAKRPPVQGKIDPRNAAAFYNRGNVRLDAGDKKGAVADLRAALKLDPKMKDAADMLK